MSQDTKNRSLRGQTVPPDVAISSKWRTLGLKPITVRNYDGKNWPHEAQPAETSPLLARPARKDLTPAISPSLPHAVCQA